MLIEKTADSLFHAVKSYLERRLKEIPAPRDGKDGADGTPGQKGIDGANGDQGPQGEKGADGTSGERGEKGDPGPKGDPGADGKDGAPGDRGEDGRDGPQGLKGMDGDPGRDGRDGPPGRDAAQLDILPSINEERSYARGTYASHKGGLWRASRATAGMDGWDCIVDGVASIDVSFVGRAGVVSVQKSSGATAMHPISLPVMVYRGVFREGEDYAPGDTVTWGGSLWHCNDATKDKPIDGSKAWQLAAKRGRDGKDGRDGIDMTKAVRLS